MAAERPPRRRRVSRRRSEGPWGNFAILCDAPGQPDRVYRIRARRDAEWRSEATAGGGYRELGPAGERAKAATAARAGGSPLGDHRQSRLMHCSTAGPYGGESSASITGRRQPRIRTTFGKRRSDAFEVVRKQAVVLLHEALRKIAARL